MKTLTVYYTFTIGNTQRIAEAVQKEIGGDIVRLETVVPYPENYSEAVAQGEDEVNRGFQPELKPLDVNIADYDRIIIGTPTWWYKMSSPVLSFLSQNDFTGKIVIPYMTNAGWPGTVIEDMTRRAEKNGATVKHSKEFRFSADEKHFDKMVTPEKDLEEWLNVLKNK